MGACFLASMETLALGNTHTPTQSSFVGKYTPFQLMFTHSPDLLSCGGSAISLMLSSASNNRRKQFTLPLQEWNMHSHRMILAKSITSNTHLFSP